MRSRTTKRFWDCFDALPPQVQKAARESFALWRKNPRHVSLQYKRVHATEPLYSVRIGVHWRALGLYENDTVTWTWIGSHSEYDRRIRRR